MEGNVRHQSPVQGSYKSRVELYDDLNDIRCRLSADCDLDTRVEALQRLEDVILQAARAGMGGLRSALNPLLEDLQGAFMDGRFKIVSQVCSLVSSLAEAMKESFAPVAEYLFMDLLNLLSLAASFSDAAHKAILAIFSNCSPTTFLDPVLVEVRESRSATVRIRCAEYVRHALLCWGEHPERPLTAVKGDLEAFIKTGVEDSAREVRSEARQCFRVYCKLWPERESPLRSSFDSAVLKVLSHEDKAMAYSRKQVQDAAQTNVQQPRGPASPQRARSPMANQPQASMQATDSASKQAPSSAEALSNEQSSGGRTGKGGATLREESDWQERSLEPSRSLFVDLKSTNVTAGLPVGSGTSSKQASSPQSSSNLGLAQGLPSWEYAGVESVPHRHEETAELCDEDTVSDTDGNFQWFDATTLALSQRLEGAHAQVPEKEQQERQATATAAAAVDKELLTTKAVASIARLLDKSSASTRLETAAEVQRVERTLSGSLVGSSPNTRRGESASTTGAALSSIKENIIPAGSTKPKQENKGGLKPTTSKSLSMSRTHSGTSPSRSTSPSHSKIGSPRTQSPKRDVSPAGSSISLPSRKEYSPRLGRPGLSDRSAAASSTKSVISLQRGLRSPQSVTAQSRSSSIGPSRATLTSPASKAAPAIARGSSLNSSNTARDTRNLSAAVAQKSTSQCIHKGTTERRPSSGSSQGSSVRGTASSRAGSPNSVSSRGSSAKTSSSPAMKTLSSPSQVRDTAKRGLQSRDDSPGASSTTSTRSRSTVVASPTGIRGTSPRLTPVSASTGRDSSPSASSSTSTRSRTIGQGSPTSSRLTGTAKTTGAPTLGARDGSPGASSTTSSRGRGARLASPTSGQDKRPRLTGRPRDVGSAVSRTVSDRSRLLGAEKGSSETLDSSSTSSSRESKKQSLTPSNNSSGSSTKRMSSPTLVTGRSTQPRVGAATQKSTTPSMAARSKAGSTLASKGSTESTLGSARKGATSSGLSSRQSTLRSSAVAGVSGKGSVAELLRGAKGKDDWTQRLKFLTGLQSVLRSASPGAQGDAGKAAADLLKHMEPVGEMLGSALESAHSKVCAAALGCAKDLVGCFSSQSVSSILPDKWLSAVLGRAADTTQPTIRQLALSTLDLMRDSFREESLLPALGASLETMSNAKAKAKTVEFGTALVQALTENRLNADTQSRLPEGCKAVELWGARLVQSSGDARLRPEALKGINTCSSLVGPQFIVDQVQSLQPEVSREILVSMAKAYPSLCKRVMQAMLQSQGSRALASSDTQKLKQREVPGTPPLDPVWVVTLSDVAHALQSSSSKQHQNPESSCGASILFEADVDVLRGDASSPSRTLSVTSDRSSTAWLRSTATDISLLSEGRLSNAQMVDEDSVREAAGRIFRYFCQMEKGPVAAKEAALRTIEEAAKQQGTGFYAEH